MKEATHYYDHHIRIYYKVEPRKIFNVKLGKFFDRVWFWDKYTQRWLKSNCHPPVEFMTKK